MNTQPKPDKLQDILERADKQAAEWQKASGRAELRKEPATAIYFRNLAWQISNGRSWLDKPAADSK